MTDVRVGSGGCLAASGGVVGRSGFPGAGVLGSIHWSQTPCDTPCDLRLVTKPQTPTSHPAPHGLPGSRPQVGVLPTGANSAGDGAVKGAQRRREPLTAPAEAEHWRPGEDAHRPTGESQEPEIPSLGDPQGRVGGAQ